MYFGLSFSRVGADFRGQLAPLFQRVAADAFRKAVEETVEKFREEMNSYTLISAPAVLGGAAGALVPSAQPGTLQPPMVLLDFPPLACFLNGLLVAFNDLRLCCPIALAQDVTACLDSALGEVTKTILAFHRAEEAAFSGREQELFVQFCTAFLEDLLPYLNRCLQVLFPPPQIAQALGEILGLAFLGEGQPQVGAPVLRGAAAAVAAEQLGGPELRRLAKALAAGLRARPCLGLSAPQLGVPLRVFAAELPPERCSRYPPALRRAHRIEPFPLRLLVNPALRVLDTRLVTAPEGCASIHGFSAYVPRHWAVHVSGVDELGAPVSWEATGWAARIIQHEMDHLDGILYIDRMDTRTFTNVAWMELMD
ncbi:hypothetical protein WISP_29765 [Willisornis vidua]|uniref:Conserved oligomeric Golgi complex subunit 8 n=1 Tax=Willisornis vidua TaxID=1566151 RepID=A0ABQ9DR36_9PASS|nr:hypothetical protein WISP_29765 [Willisornis vidua]